MDFTAEQQEIIQKCHDNELPRTYAEELYNKLLALLPPKTEAEQEADDAVTVMFKNPNSVEVTTRGTFRDVGGDPYGTGSTPTSANDMAAYLTISLDSSGQYRPGWTVTLYFTAAGYPDSATTTYKGLHYLGGNFSRHKRV